MLWVRTRSFACSPEPRVEYGGVMMTAEPQESRSTSPFQEFFRTEAAGGALLVACACAALIVANSAWADAYHRLSGDDDRHCRGRACAVAHRASVDQRRAHGGLLSPCRTGDQTRGACRRTGVPAPGGAADCRSDRRHGRPGFHLFPDERRRNGVARVGDSHGDRHRLRARRTGTRRAPSPKRAQDLPGGPGHRGRHGGGVGDRALLHGRHRVGRPGDGGPHPAVAHRPERSSHPAPDALSGSGSRALVLCARVRRARHDRRRAARLCDSDPNAHQRRRSSRPRLAACWTISIARRPAICSC